MGAEESTGVLVVGAGPTGLTAANCLAKLGVPFVLADRKDGPTRESRALGVQARTMEIYDQLGLIDTVLPQTWPAEAVVPGYEDRAFAAVPLLELGRRISPYPKLYILEQSRNERILADRLHAVGVEIRWGHELRALEASQDGGVVATLAGPGGEVRVVRARYCIGADGASSAVRTLSGIPFEGITNPHTFYVADATGVEGLVEGRINLRMAPDDFLLSFPMGPDGANRLLGVVPGDRVDLPVESVEGEVRERLAQVFRVRWGRSAWLSTYRVHHRAAARFRDGPVFLAGDAAHVHSPVGAQGMNTGIQDAHNLACKLGDVLAGRATDAYLDRYEAERRPVALRLVASTDRIFGAVTSRRRSARFLRRRIVPVAVRVAVRFLPRLSGASRIFGYLSQTRIHYWMTPLDGPRRRRRERVVGRRLPWNGQNYECLRSMTWQVHSYDRRSWTAATELGRRLGIGVQTFSSPGHNGLRRTLLYLVRPDGFVAAAAVPESGAEAFQASLLLGERPSPVR